MSNYLKIDVSKPFQPILPHELRTGDIYLLYDGNSLTEAHGSWMRQKKYGHIKPCPYHAFIHYDRSARRARNLVLDTEIRTTLSFLDFEYTTKKDVRIDVIRYPLAPEQIDIILNEIELVGGKEPYYGVRRYASYLKQVWGLRWVGKVLEPKGDKELVCSNRAAKIHDEAYNKVSYQHWKDTTPADLAIYAVKSGIPVCYTLKDKGVVYEPTKF